MKLHTVEIKKVRHFISLALFLSIHTFITYGQTTATVGTLPGSVDVSPSGAATYTIPLEAVPGTQGIQPQLGISYNSASGVGILGMKWHLSGLSAITRISQTLYPDGNVTGVNLDNNDRYALDGSRLVLVDAYYKTEVESYTRVYEKELSGVRYFEAVTEDGKVIQYGATADSRQTSNGKIISWMIHKITDANGNYMTYSYGQSNGEIWITRIDYTGNPTAGLSPYASVRFDYLTDNVNKNTAYVGGEALTQSQLLSAVKVYYGSTLVRTYTFTYEQGKITRLKEIKLTNPDNSFLHATQITWGNEAQEFTFQDLAVSGKIVGDFNGDGIPDLFTSTATYDQNNQTYTHAWTVLSGDGYGGFSQTLATGSFGNHTYNGKLVPADINGDGKDELLVVYRNKTQGSIYYYEFSSSQPVLTNLVPVMNDFAGFSIGDFNGDGAADVLILRVNTGTKKSTLGVTLFNKPSLNPLQLDDIIPFSSISVCDFTGNGKTNIQIVKETQNYIYEYDLLQNAFIHIAGGGFPTSYHHICYGDFNGDGKSDILAKVIGSGKWVINLSTGTHYTWPHQETPLDASIIGGPYSDKNVKYPPLVVDVNGDGKDDIVQTIFNYTTQKLTVHIYYTESFENAQYKYRHVSFEKSNAWSEYDPTAQFPNYQFADFNCDGKTDMLQGRSLTYFYKNEQSHLVQQIMNGLGAKTQLSYAHLTSPAVRYQGEFANRVPYPVVTEVTHVMQPENRVTKYAYSRVQFDMARRQLLGFGLFQANQQGIVSEQTYVKNDTYHHLMLKSSEAYYSTGTFKSGVVSGQNLAKTTLITQTDHSISYIPLNGGKRFCPYYASSTTKNTQKNSKTLAITVMNSDVFKDARPVQEIVSTYSATTNVMLVSCTTDYKYTYKTTATGIPNRTVLDSVITTERLKMGDLSTYSSLTTKVGYGYAYTRLAGVTEYKKDKTRTTAYSNFNAFGVPLTQTVSGDGISRPTSGTYDPTGRFVWVHTNRFLETKADYDAKTGNILNSTDVNSLRTYYTYDAFGNNLSTTSPDGTVSNTSAHWYSSSIIMRIPEAKYYIRQTAAASPETQIYYDAWGREVCRYVQGTGYSDTRYTAKGAIEKTSMPYPTLGADDNTKIWTSYTYDALGRCVSQKAPYTDVTISYTIEGNNSKVTTTDKLRNTTSSQTCDALGRIVTATDPAGSVTYTYERGKTTIKPVKSSIVTIIQTDLWGNRTSLTDPDAGTVTSSYNVLGDLLSQTDALGNTTSYQYDNLGRISYKTYSGPSGTDVIRYTYDHYINTMYHGKGKPYQTYINNVLYETYLYDIKSRLVSKTTRIDGTDYVQRYGYAATGLLETVTYPDGFCTKHSYNELGELSEIRNNADNSLIYQVASRNLFRQPLTAWYGNGTGTQHTYNAYGMLTQLRTGNKERDEPDIGIQPLSIHEEPIPLYKVGNQYRTLNYTYNNLGLITQRSDTKVGQTETYTYDNLDRLTSYRVGTNTAKTFGYDLTGNLTSHSSVGTYSYTAAQPHAVNIVTPYASNTISASQCNTTYNNRNRPKSITEFLESLELSYGTGTMRNKAVYKARGATYKTKYYISGLYEKEITGIGTATRHLDYIYAEGNLVAIRTNNNTTASMYYVYTDHLGSYNLVLDQNKATQLYCHYDPWGNRKLYTDWSATHTSGSFVFDRGFTGHEHLDGFKIINMNARLYDPVIGRFFSPDPQVQSPNSTQSYNRYSYCMNNPIMFNDPDGEFWHIVIGGAIGGIINWAANGAEFSWKGLGYFGVGAVAGALGAGIGAGVSSAIAGGSFGAGFVGTSGALTAATSFWSGAAIGGGAGFSSGFTLGFGNGLIGGQNIGQSLLQGIKGGLIGGVSGAIVGGLYGGIDALYDERTFWGGRGEGSKIYESPISNNFGNENGECVYRSLEECSKSYGMDNYDFDYWVKQNGYNINDLKGVDPNNLKSMVNSSKVFSSTNIGGNPNSIADAISNNQRVIIANENHAAMVGKIRIWPSGKYKVWIMETSPIRIFPSTLNDISRGYRFWSFFKL